MRYINSSAVRRLALDVSAVRRAGKFTRVSSAWLSLIDRKLCRLVEAEVMRHPSIGKTLLP